MNRVLVTGATGFIGLEVARQLAEQGLRPRLLVRRPERALLVKRLAAELVSGDLTSPASLERAVRRVDTVLHLGARAAFEPAKRLRPTIVDGSLALIRAAAEAGVGTFVFASSLMVYGSQRGPIHAATPARPEIDYGRVKIEAEEAMGRVAEESGMRFAAVRLPHVYGARSLLFDSIHRGRVVLPGRGENLFGHLHVADAARILIAVAERGWTGASPVADERSASWREFLSVVQLHYPRLKVSRMPSALALLGARLVGLLLRFRSRASMITPDTVVGWNLELPVAPGLLWRELGLAPGYPTIDEGIPAALDDCVAFRWLHSLADRAA